MPTSPSPLPSDGPLHYRHDPSTGRTVVVMPASCRHLHNLAAVGYRASELGGQLRVTCSACVASGRAEPQWVLDLAPGAGEVGGAELDDTPYSGLGWDAASRRPRGSAESAPAPPAGMAPRDVEVASVAMRLARQAAARGSLVPGSGSRRG